MRKLGKSIAGFWMHRYKLIFFFTLLAVCAWSGFLWYRDLYLFQWSPEEKQAYINEHDRRVAFRHDTFNAVLENLERRQALYMETLPSLRDIFLENQEEK